MKVGDDDADDGCEPAGDQADQVQDVDDTCQAGGAGVTLWWRMC